MVYRNSICSKYFSVLEFSLYSTVRHKLLTYLHPPRRPTFLLTQDTPTSCVMFQATDFAFNSFSAYRRNLTTMFTYYFKAVAIIQLLTYCNFFHQILSQVDLPYKEGLSYKDNKKLRFFVI